MVLDSTLGPDSNGNELKKVSSTVNTPDLPRQYQGLLDANPYLNLDYKQSGWQKFLSNLGFRTGYDKRVEDMQLQANEYNANVAAMAFENEYNSDSAKSERMRSAGLNPDLLGTGDSADSASLPEDTNPPASTESDESSISQFGSMLLSGFSTAVGFAKDIGTLNQLRLANESQDISNVQGIMNTAFDAVLKHTPTILDTDPDIAADSLNRVHSAIGEIYKGSMSKRTYKRFMSEVGALMTTAPTEAERYKVWYQRMQNRQAAVSQKSSEYYIDDNDAVLSDIIAPLVELNDRFLRAEKSSSAFHAENSESFEQTSQDIGLPESEARVQKSENDQQAQEFNMQRELRSTMSKIIHKLKDRADSGKRGSGLADTTLLIFSIMSLMNGVHTSSSSSGWIKEGKNAYGASSSSSFGIGF